jgi:TonB family protein
MSTSATFLEENSKSGNRRGCRREPLKWVVLVYFGENNWGRLLNLNETGMCLEFADAPSQGERIGFTLQAMGLMPEAFGGEIISETFAAAGEIKWTREFERTAGVQFAELKEESREQIRHWLSFEASIGSDARGNETSETAEAPIARSELAKPAEVFAEPPLEKVERDETLSEGGHSESSIEGVGTLETSLAERIPEAPTFEAYSKVREEQTQNRKAAPGLDSWRKRIGVTAVPGVVAVLIVMAVLKMMLPAGTRKSEAADRLPARTVVQTAPVNAKYHEGAGNRTLFLVEVQDAENRHWLLWFDHNSARTVSAPTSIAASSHVALSEGVSGRQAASARSEPARKFALVTPKVNRPKTNGLSEASISNALIVSGEAPPLDAALGGILMRGVKPPPATGALPVANEVQQARLIKAVPPAYPTLAKANHVTGDVTLDALIDANGGVTEVQVVAGPGLLREAAVNAMRLWKYEPARLGGRAVPSHLSVTVKFRFD